MSKKVFFASLTFIVLSLALSACDASCDTGSLLSPDLVSPDWREVVDGSAAIFEWSYSDTCEPENYEISFSRQRDFSDIVHTELVPGSSTTWMAPTMDIAEEYFWRMRAKVGSTYGPYSLELRSFFTLPYCSAGDLVMPYLITPDWGGIFDRAYDSLEWTWPLSTCIPEFYKVEVSWDSPSYAAGDLPSFAAATTYTGIGSDPGTRWGLGPTPPAASQFFWRISAFADGVYGPTAGFTMAFTDPICPAASLVAPLPLQPNGIITTGHPLFQWSYPDPSCTPEGDYIRVSTAPDMSAIVLYLNHPDLAGRSRLAGPGPLDDCETYYWDIAMISEGVQGPRSGVNVFSINIDGTCACDPLDIPIPELVSPEPIWTGDYDIVPLDPSLVWDNPGFCLPDGYEINLSDLPAFIDPALDGEVFDGLTTNYTPQISLEPASQYWWRVLLPLMEIRANPAILVVFSLNRNVDLPVTWKRQFYYRLIMVR